MSESEDLDQAITESQEALRETPNSSELHYSLGLALFEKGDIESTIAEFREAIRLGTAFGEVHFSLAKALTRKGGENEVLEAVREYREGFRLMGIACLQRGDLDGAITVYRGAIEVEPMNPEAHYGLGCALCRKGPENFGEGLSEYREALRLNPTHAEAAKAFDIALMQRDFGWALPDDEDLELATIRYRELLRQRPEDADIHHALAKALRQQQEDTAVYDLDETLAEYREALRLRPAFAEAHFGLGWTLQMKGDLNGAIAQYRETLRLRPDLIYARYFLGFLLQQQGAIEDSIGEYRAVLRVLPDDGKVHSSLGWALREYGYQHLTEAIAEFQQAVRFRPDFVSAEIARQSTFLQRVYGRPPLQPQKPEGSVSEYREKLRKNPEDVEAHYKLGWVLARKMDLADAIAEFSQTLQVRPDHAEAHCSLGYVLLLSVELGAYNHELLEKSNGECREAIRLRPDMAEAHYCLGLAIRGEASVKQDFTQRNFALTEEGKQEISAAIAACREALRLRQDYSEAHFALGWALDLIKDTDGAIAEYKEAIRLHPNNPYWHARLGWVLNEKGDSAGAVAEYQTTMQLDPNFPPSILRIGS